MLFDRLLLIFGVVSVLAVLAHSLTATPFLSPNPIYSSAGTYNFNTAPYFNSATTNLAPLTFSITFTRSHTTTNYSFAYTIKQIIFTIVNNKVNYTLEGTTKTATSAAINFYTSNANKISNLAIAYILIQPLFSINGFFICWIKPNSNIFNGQFFQQTVTGVGPFTSTTQTIWVTLVGVDASLAANNQMDLYATASLPSTTSILFKISTISPTTFYLTSVIIQVFIYDQTLLESNPRQARFTSGQANSLAIYSNSAIQTYNTIYGVRTYHTVNQNYLNYTWNLTATSLTITSNNTFSWVAFDYLILEFITCAPATPYLLISNKTCFDAVPVRYYSDEYNECQACPYDCYQCYSNGSCSQCSSSLDFRVINSATLRCVPINGYFESNTTVALACNASACLTCTSLTFCLTCPPQTYLSATNTCPSCISNCLSCTTGTNCLLCATFYTFKTSSCLIDCSSISKCLTCTVNSSVLMCTSCAFGYNLIANACPVNRNLTGNSTCGNGLLQGVEACDDGNKISNDGCSSTCLVEASFTCTQQNPSTCNLISFNPVLLSLTKNPSSNQFTITLLMTPITLQSYASVNWSSVAIDKSNLNASITATTFNQTTSKLAITYTYKQNMNDNVITLMFNFPNLPPFQNILNTTTQYILTQEDTNLSLDVFSDQVYDTSPIIYIISMVISAVALLMFIIGFFKGKIVALELITIFQLSYLSLTAVDKLTPTMQALTGLSLSCGYALSFFQSTSINNKFAALKLKILFFENYNLSFVFIVLSIFLSIILGIVCKCKSLGQSSKVYVLSKRMRGEWVFYSLMFSLYITAISLGLTVSQYTSIKIMELFGMLIEEILIIGILWLGSNIVTENQKMGEFVICFSQNKGIASNYYFLLIFERCLTASALLSFTFNKQLPIIICLIGVQMILIIGLKPYTMFGDRLRPLLNLSITLIIEILYLLLPSLPSSVRNLYGSYGILGLLGFAVCYNIYYFKIAQVPSLRGKIAASQDSVEDRSFLPDRSLSHQRSPK